MTLAQTEGFAPAIGIGVTDLHLAARAEVARIVGAAGTDVVAQGKLLLAMLRDRELVTEAELRPLGRLVELEAEVQAGKLSPADAGAQARALYTAMLVDPHGGQVARVIAASAVGGYAAGPASPAGARSAPAAAANDGHWATRGAITGAAIGAVWGPLGAGIGGAVGGLVGDIADHCVK